MSSPSADSVSSFLDWLKQQFWTVCIYCTFKKERFDISGYVFILMLKLKIVFVLNWTKIRSVKMTNLHFILARLYFDCAPWSGGQNNQHFARSKKKQKGISRFYTFIFAQTKQTFPLKGSVSVSWEIVHCWVSFPGSTHESHTWLSNQLSYPGITHPNLNPVSWLDSYSCACFPLASTPLVHLRPRYSGCRRDY